MATELSSRECAEIRNMVSTLLWETGLWHALLAVEEFIEQIRRPRPRLRIPNSAAGRDCVSRNEVEIRMSQVRSNFNFGDCQGGNLCVHLAIPRAEACDHPYE